MVAAIPDILFEVDPVGRYLQIWTKNPELLAQQREALLGRTIGEVLPPDQAAIAMEAIREADEDGASSSNDQRAGVMLIDIDRFKAVNDTMGHSVGDELLCQAAERLKASVRDRDTVARLGGDELGALGAARGLRDRRRAERRRPAAAQGGDQPFRQRVPVPGPAKYGRRLPGQHRLPCRMDRNRNNRSLLLNEKDGTLETLSKLRAMGISIAIDDFGTGYSALNYLSRYPIDTLKIDRSFINSADKRSAELVKAILSIARCLGQNVVAEGVETVAQAPFLAANGCDAAQGFLYSRPLPKSEIRRLPRRLGDMGLAV